MPNIASCRTGDKGPAPGLVVGIVRRVDIAPEAAQPIDFGFNRHASDEGVSVRMEAAQGPLGTRDYRIELGVIALDADRSFLRLRYGYRYGTAARLASQAYLSTSGSGRRGFTVVGHGPDGRPRHIEGMRGAVERNAMRCYLAIESVLRARDFDEALTLWIDSTQRYPQLVENDPRAFAVAKRKAHQRSGG